MKAMLGAAALLFLFWLPAVNVPFWQDDYEFLLAARNARAETGVSSWVKTLAPDADQQLWRPIGVGVWWRFVEGVLGGNARAAHIASIVLLVLASAAVGWLAVTIDSCDGAPGLQTGGTSRTPGLKTRGSITAFLYGIHGAHFLSVAWVSAASDSIAVLFGALALRYWIVGYMRGQARSLAASLFFLVLALGSRENAVVLPLLGLVLSLAFGRSRRKRSGLVFRPRLERKRAPASYFAVAAFGITLGWIFLRSTYAAGVAPAYAMELGSVFRNAGSLAFFALNGPREMLRFMLQQPSAAILLWGLTCVLAQTVAVLLLLRSKPDRRTVIYLAAFFAIACLPYLFLARNSYEYYVSFGLMGYAMLIVISQNPGVSRSMRVVTALAVLSSALFASGNYRLEYPALIARARWAERQLQLLEAARHTDSRITTGRLFVRVEDIPRFQSFGAAGLAYRLGIDRRQIVGLTPGDPLPDAGPILVVPAQGDVYLLR